MTSKKSAPPMPAVPLDEPDEVDPVEVAGFAVLQAEMTIADTKR